MLELGEAAGPFGQVVDEQGRPLRADDLRAAGDGAGLVVHVLHRAHRHGPSVTGYGARGNDAVIDLHSHILPGVDDGPATLEESLELARRAAADGVRVIAATPHVRDDYPTQPATMERLVAELRAAIQQEGIPIDVRPGAEIAIDWLDRLSDDDLGRFGLGGSP